MEMKGIFLMNINELHESFKNCSCKKEHNCPIDHVVIGRGVLSSLPKLCERYENIILVSDENTWQACAKDAFGILEGKIKKNLVLAANGDVVIPNEEKIDEIEKALPDGCDLIIGTGSGVINDLCKYVSFKNDLPYYIIATAPSMDGYASVGAALILEGMKITLNARPPKAIIADTAVLAQAPIDMIRAGYGDIIGKYSCLNDWRLSALINGEYFCQKVYDLTYSCADKVKNMAKGINVRDEETVGGLMEALVTVGIAMSYVDCSRPASGSEHHLSHFFEITGILDKKEYFSHGIDVVYSSVETAKLREKLVASTPKKIEFDRKKWENDIRRIYTTSADGIIKLQDKLGWYETDDSENVISKWEEIKEILADSPTPSEFVEMIEDAGLDYSEFEKLYGNKKISDAVRYAKDLKDRYSVLWLNFRYFD
ncbi:MAG: sn-glycerol-1-phosphate dehydrogenase [Ruminococcaceae bacterium]|nr:sn-glycerol-1-phosphate dehydrogenase [Oscillospiraceae bacterium]